MHFSSMPSNLFGSVLEDGSIFLSDYIYQLIIELGIDMTDFTVVHVPTYCLLFPIDFSVGNAYVIRIEFKSAPEKSLTKISVVE